MTKLRNYYYNNLSYFDKVCYIDVLEQLQRYSSQITVKYSDNFSDVLTSITNDHPELFYVDWGGLIRYYCRSGNIVLDPIYLYNPRESAEFLRRIEQFVSMLDCGGDDYAIAKRVHDFLFNRVKYDNAARHLRRPDSHSIIGPLLFDEGVCEGMAEAAQYFFDRLNIDSTVILSRGENNIGHKWNVISIDGQPYHMDLTGDIGAKWDDKLISYDFFLISDEEMRRFNAWAEGPLSSTDGKDYFVREGMAASSDIELTRLLKRINPKQPLYFKTTGEYSKNSLGYIFEFCRDILAPVAGSGSLECKANTTLGIYYLKLVK